MKRARREDINFLIHWAQRMGWDISRDGIAVQLMSPVRDGMPVIITILDKPRPSILTIRTSNPKKCWLGLWDAKYMLRTWEENHL